MLRLIVGASLGAALLSSVTTVGAAHAAAPGCPPGFDLGRMSLQSLATLVIGAGLEGATVEEFVAFADEVFDKNDDGFVCVLDVPETPGTPPYAFNVVDNRFPR